MNPYRYDRSTGEWKLSGQTVHPSLVELELDRLQLAKDIAAPPARSLDEIVIDSIHAYDIRRPSYLVGFTWDSNYSWDVARKLALSIDQSGDSITIWASDEQTKIHDGDLMLACRDVKGNRVPLIIPAKMAHVFRKLDTFDARIWLRDDK